MLSGKRRTVMAVVLAASVAAVAACGGLSGRTTGLAKGPTASGEPLTEAQLIDALPVSSDLRIFTVEPQSALLLEPQDIVTTGQLDCRPIADMMSVRPRHPRQSMVWATLRSEGPPQRATSGSVTLTSHLGEGATAWMAELKIAVTDCTDFVATSERGWTHRFRVRKLSPVNAGDDAVNYLITNVLSPNGRGNVMTVVRTGATFATYLLDEQEDGPSPIPDSIATRQHKKIQAVGARQSVSSNLTLMRG